MIIHAYDEELNYLGCREVEKVTIEIQEQYVEELQVLFPNANIGLDVEPSDGELEGLIVPSPDDDLPF